MGFLTGIPSALAFQSVLLYRGLGVAAAPRDCGWTRALCSWAARSYLCSLGGEERESRRRWRAKTGSGAQEEREWRGWDPRARGEETNGRRDCASRSCIFEKRFHVLQTIPKTFVFLLVIWFLIVLYCGPGLFSVFILTECKSEDVNQEYIAWGSSPAALLLQTNIDLYS